MRMWVGGRSKARLAVVAREAREARAVREAREGREGRAARVARVARVGAVITSSYGVGAMWGKPSHDVTHAAATRSFISMTRRWTW